MTDLISRADAIKAVASITMSIHLSDVICGKLLALPSAEAKPTHTQKPERSTSKKLHQKNLIPSHKR